MKFKRFFGGVDSDELFYHHHSFEEILARSTKLPERMNFIYSLPSSATGDEIPVVRAWCKKESDKVLSGYKAADVNDVPTILSIIRVAGLQAFTRVCVAVQSYLSSRFDEMR